MAEEIKLIIVEDEGIVALDLANRLRKMRYSVSAVVDTGEKAVRAVAEARPDLVLMDIRLKSNMDGIQAAGEIQARFDIPVIFVTALADVETRQRAKAVRHYGYINKPFDEDELHLAIQAALSQHVMKNQARSGVD